MYHPFYLKGLRELCTKYDVFLIADEVAVGFGRTGKMFAVQHAKITPDFMVLSKGLTAGYLPLSCVMLTQKIYNAFYCEYNNGLTSFLHSHSYTGNPLACSSALASLKYLKKYNILKTNKQKIRFISSQLKRFESINIVTNIRQTGMIGAFDIKGYDTKQRITLEVYQYCLKYGVLLRPLGNTIYFMPPYIINEKQLKKIFDVAYEAINMIKDNFPQHKKQINIMGSEVVQGFECKPKVLDKNKPIMHYKTLAYVCVDKRCSLASTQDKVKDLRQIVKDLNLDKGQNRIKISRSMCQGACRYRQVMQINDTQNNIWLKHIHKFTKKQLEELFLSLSLNKSLDDFPKIDMKVYD
jgi:adenosylmethionine-8-amino-7-oxononanoate aminotransferase